jgi:hypothetical protein
MPLRTGASFATSAAADTETWPASTFFASSGTAWSRTAVAARTLRSDTFSIRAASGCETGAGDGEAHEPAGNASALKGCGVARRLVGTGLKRELTHVE